MCRFFSPIRQRIIRSFRSQLLSCENGELHNHNQRTGKIEETIRISDLAKLGTKAERIIILAEH